MCSAISAARTDILGLGHDRVELRGIGSPVYVGARAHVRSIGISEIVRPR